MQRFRRFSNPFCSCCAKLENGATFRLFWVPVHPWFADSVSNAQGFLKDGGYLGARRAAVVIPLASTR